MAWCSKNHRNNKSMWCFCFERFCFHRFSWKLLTFNQREQSQFQLEMNVYCISWLRQIFEFDCCSCPSNISFKFMNCCSPLVWTFLHKITLYNVCSTVGVFSTVGDIMSTVGDILSTVGVFSTMGGYHDKCGGIFWVPWGNIMSTVGGYLEYHGGYHDVHGGYHEYRRGCLARYWTPPTVLHTHYTGWKSYKIQGDCQVFSIFKRLFIFIKLKVLDDTLFHGFTG